MEKVKKSNVNILLLSICCVLIVISSVYAYTTVKSYNEYIDSIKNNNSLNPLLPLNSAFTYWIGNGHGLTAHRVFYYVMFFGAVIPCIITVIKERKNAVQNNSASRYLSVFCTSGLVGFIPLIVNMISTMMFIPADRPDSIYDIYYNVISTDFLSELFYSHPIMYELFYILLVSVICGLIGCFGFALAKLCGSRFIALIVPECIIGVLHLVDKYYFDNFEMEKGVSLINLSKNAASMMVNIKTVLIEIVILFAFVVVLYSVNSVRISVKKGRKEVSAT